MDYDLKYKDFLFVRLYCSILNLVARTVCPFTQVCFTNSSGTRIPKVSLYYEASLEAKFPSKASEPHSGFVLSAVSIFIFYYNGYRVRASRFTLSFLHPSSLQ
jgi:hypothetical protein